MTRRNLTERAATMAPMTSMMASLGEGRIGRRSALAAGLGLIAVPLLARAGFAAGMAMIDASQYDVGTVLASYSEFSTFESVLQQSGLAGEARSAQNFTLFAPTNRAFARYPNFIQQLIPGGSQMFPNTAKLIAYIRNHVVAGIYLPDAIAGKKLTLTSLGGEQIEIDGTGSGEPSVTYHLTGGGAVGGTTAMAHLTEQPIRASNGVIYPINDTTLS